VIIDIGYQLTEVGVVVDGKLVKQDSLAWGGKDVTRAVEQVIVQRYGLKVGWHWLERVKFHLPDLLVGHEVEVKENGQAEASTSKATSSEAARPIRRINIRGVSTTDNLAVTQTVHSNDFQAAVQQLAEQLVAKIKLVLQQVDSGVIVAALDNGIYLTGGGSLLPGLEQYLAAQLKTQVRTSQQPYAVTVSSVG
jgi:rod shape-determining protein MreB